MFPRVARVASAVGWSESGRRGVRSSARCPDDTMSAALAPALFAKQINYTHEHVTVFRMLPTTDH